MAPSLPDLLFDRPDCVLALMFSAPARQASAIQSVTVDFTDEEVRATVKRPRSSTVAAPRLLASKDTIFAAILLYQLDRARDSEFADSLVHQRNALLDARFTSVKTTSSTKTAKIF